MSVAPLAELVDGLPNLCSAEAQVEEVPRELLETKRNRISWISDPC